MAVLFQKARIPAFPPGGGGGGVTSIGGRTRCSRRRKKRVKKGIQFRGGRGARKGCQKPENGEKAYPNRCDQNSSHAIKRGKGT